jgi:hypothetical protein
VGVADAGAEGGPWLVLYCEARYVGAGPRPGTPVDGNPADFLGPLVVRQRWDNLVYAEQMAKSQSRKLGDGLYLITVPVAKRGTCHLVLEDGAGQVVAKKDVVVGEVAKTYWGTFADLKPGVSRDFFYAARPVIGARGRWMWRRWRRRCRGRRRRCLRGRCRDSAIGCAVVFAGALGREGAGAAVGVDVGGWAVCGEDGWAEGAGLGGLLLDGAVVGEWEGGGVAAADGAAFADVGAEGRGGGYVSRGVWVAGCAGGGEGGG